MEASASNSNASRNDWQRLRSYFAQFAGPHQAVVESTGFWYWLADLLDELGVELLLAHATRPWYQHHDVATSLPVEPGQSCNELLSLLIPRLGPL